ncbi:hypothetical protein Bbelb_095590 [Branchiostoma belcheri]|nr:hypothetical protein Bbelb_095590 [Branchiostoma belcheri]
MALQAEEFFFHPTQPLPALTPGLDVRIRRVETERYSWSHAGDRTHAKPGHYYTEIIEKTKDVICSLEKLLEAWKGFKRLFVELTRNVESKPGPEDSAVSRLASRGQAAVFPRWPSQRDVHGKKPSPKCHISKSDEPFVRRSRHVIVGERPVTEGTLRSCWIEKHKRRTGIKPASVPTLASTEPNPRQDRTAQHSTYVRNFSRLRILTTPCLARS